ncbi:MAG: fatty acid desaturase [Myxococcota bacterium]
MDDQADASAQDPSRLWQVDDKYYDLEPFLEKHPGGRRFLEQTRGTDCTALFHSTHLHDQVPRATLKKYFVGTVEDYRARYDWEGDGFYPTLKRRVRDHYAKAAKAKGERGRELRRAHHGTSAFFLRFAAIYSLFIALSVAAVGFGQWWAALLWGPVAFAIGGYGHEAMHAGVFRTVRANRALALSTLDLMGVSSFVFTAMHVPLHHIHTNEPDVDPDIEVHFPLVREFEGQPRYFFHRLQHVYAWVLYFITFPVLWFADVIAAASGWWFGPYGKMERPRWREALLFAGFKLLSASLWYVLPYFLLPWETALLMQTLMIGGAGLMVQGTFALSHQNALAMNLRHDPNPDVRDWGVAQMRTTADFQHGHWLPVTFFGGLGYQIEHHLFPTISYSRLDEIVPIVKETCAEFGVPYHYYPTAWSALVAHYQFLRRMGDPVSASLEDEAVAKDAVV